MKHNATPAMFDTDQDTLIDVPMEQPTTPKIKRWYVGCGETYETFQSETEPTQASHGDRYPATIGPFRTRKACILMARFGRGNPHFGSVEDAERFAEFQRLGILDDDLNTIQRQA